jgi:guanylate kinase
MCIVISAPSGAGKSSVTRALLAKEDQLTVSVSVTTRAPRPGERDGVDYHFTSLADFEQLRDSGALLEHAEVFGRYYGTPRRKVLDALEGGTDVVFDIDWQGWRQLKAALPDDAVGVFILPPSLNALRQRLHSRAGDSEAEIERRMRAAVAEISHWREFDHVVVNDELARCVEEIGAVLHANRSATRRRLELPGFVSRLVAEAP